MVDLEFDDKNYFTFYAAAEYNGKLVLLLDGSSL